MKKAMYRLKITRYQQLQWNSYNRQYAYDHEKKEPFFHWEFREILQLYHPKKGDRALEIGCNTGEFCHLLAERFGCYVKGIDVNRYAIEIATSKYPDLSFEVSDLMDIEDSGYDVIYMQHVIEHLEKPKEALLFARSMLRKGGRLFLSCPNKWAYLLKFGARLFGTRFCYDPTHLHCFSPKSLSKLLSESYFSVEIIRTKPFLMPIQKMPYWLQEFCYRLPACFLGGYIFLLAKKL